MGFNVGHAAEAAARHPRPSAALAAAYKNGLMASETNQTVSRVINAPASDIFDALSNPDRHTDFDGSGFVRSADKPQRIQKVGDVFRMNMEGDHMGG